MRLRQLLPGLLFTGSVLAILSTPAYSNEIGQVQHKQSTSTPNGKGVSSQMVFKLLTSAQLSGKEGKAPRIHRANLLAQVSAPSSAEIVQVTGVKVQLLDKGKGLEVILETNRSEQLQVLPQSNDSTYTADIKSAQLKLSSGNSIREEKPIAGIAEVTVTNLDANTIRVTVIAEAGTPKVELFDGDEGLVFGVAADAVAQTQQQPETLPQAEASPQPRTNQPETQPEAQASPNQSADENEEPIELVVTATRTEENVLNVPRSVTIIRREQIEQQSSLSRNLGDILQNLVPGLGTSTQLQSNFTQGLRGRGVQVLVDGVPVSSNINNSTSGADLRRVDPSVVERIEVVRGASAVYGDGGTGGVINIITRRPSEQKLTSEVEVGVNASAGDRFLAGESFGNFFKYGISGTEGIFDYVASFSRTTFGDPRDAEGDIIPLSPDSTANSSNINVYTRLGLNLGEEQRLQFAYNQYQESQDQKFISDPVVDEIPGIQKSRALRGNFDFVNVPEPGNDGTIVSLNYTNDSLFGSQLQAQAYYRNTETRAVGGDNRIFDPEAVLPITQSVITSERFGGRLQIQTPIAQALSVLWGADYSNENSKGIFNVFDTERFDNSGGRDLFKISETTRIPEYDIDNLGLFTQLQWEATPQLIFSGGLRYERIGVSVGDYTLVESGNSVRGGDKTLEDVVFNTGVVYKATDTVSVFANFSQGFSLPDIANVFGGLPDGFNFGEDLDLTSPQKVDNYEIGIRGEWSNLQASVSAFYNTSQLGIGTRFISINQIEFLRAPQRNYGLEFALDWQPSENWQFGGTVSWVEGERENDEGEYLAIASTEISPLKLTAYIENQTLPGWRNRFQALYSGTRDRAFNDGIDLLPIKDFFVVDYISGLKIGSGELQVGVQNLFNNQYESIYSQFLSGFADSLIVSARGRTISVNYRINF
ncbi:TonB-dependent receptor [Nostoc sp. HG1]|nr:TonB-dependent receptor [Nostoc sp. HG1]